LNIRTALVTATEWWTYSTLVVNVSNNNWWCVDCWTQAHQTNNMIDRHRRAASSTYRGRMEVQHCPPVARGRQCSEDCRSQSDWIRLHWISHPADLRHHSADHRGTASWHPHRWNCPPARSCLVHSGAGQVGRLVETKSWLDDHRTADQTDLVHCRTVMTRRHWSHGSVVHDLTHTRTHARISSTAAEPRFLRIF